ncbi:D-2-hydroxyacid dehydrogenase [soil metagenome]
MIRVGERGAMGSERLNVVVLGDPGDPLLQTLSARYDATFVIAKDEDALAAAAPDADAILSWWANRDLLDAVLARAPRARWVHSIATGLDRITSPTLTAHPSVLTNTRDVFSPALAEFAVLGMLFFAKNAARLLRARDARRWEPFEVETLRGKILGVVGFGSIGRETARLAAAFGMKVHVHRRHPERQRPDPLVSEVVVDRRELFATSDYVVLAAPLTPETHHLAAAAELARMKPSAVLINVCRGGLIDEPALIDVLQRRAIRGAALDVFATEPLPPEHPFFAMENVLLSPHCADRTATWLAEALALFLENLGRFRAGAPLLHPVDKALGY